MFRVFIAWKCARAAVEFTSSYVRVVSTKLTCKFDIRGDCRLYSSDLQVDDVGIRALREPVARCVNELHIPHVFDVSYLSKRQLWSVIFTKKIIESAACSACTNINIFFFHYTFL